MNEKKDRLVAIKHYGSNAFYLFPAMTKGEVLQYILKNKLFGDALTEIVFYDALKEHSLGVKLIMVDNEASS